MRELTHSHEPGICESFDLGVFELQAEQFESYELKLDQSVNCYLAVNLFSNCESQQSTNCSRYTKYTK